MLLAVENRTIKFTERLVLDNVNFYLNEGEKIGLIGVNGSGKSTLLNELMENPSFRNKEAKIGYLPQSPTFDENLTVLDIVMKSIDKEDMLYEAKAILTKFGINDLSQTTKNLSGGEKKKVAIASAIVSNRNCLILDEPTNHLDIDMIAFLEKFLIRFKGAILMVTHDRYFLDRITNKIVELDNGSVYTYNGNYQKYLELREARLLNESVVNKRKKAFLKREIEWVKAGVQARETKSRARLENYYKIKAMVVNEKKEAMVIKNYETRLGKKTIELINVSKSMNNRLLIDDFSYLVLRGDRMGIIGDNGCGKSTLLKLITNKLIPDKGEIIIGETVKIGYYSQDIDDLDLDSKIIDFVNKIDSSLDPVNELENFLFPRSMHQTLIKRLSGGEQKRLKLLCILMSEPNILLLDEPTNDLDIQTLSLLEEYLENFKGALLVVSHDRYFLDKVVDHIFHFEGSSIKEYLGGYSSFIAEYEKPILEITKKEAIKTPKKNKMTYQERKEYEKLEIEIAELEEIVRKCDQEMISASNDYKKVLELDKEKSMATSSLEEKTNRYFELAMKEEE